MFLVGIWWYLNILLVMTIGKIRGWLVARSGRPVDIRYSWFPEKFISIECMMSMTWGRVLKGIRWSVFHFLVTCVCTNSLLSSKIQSRERNSLGQSYLLLLLLLLPQCYKELPTLGRCKKVLCNFISSQASLQIRAPVQTPHRSLRNMERLKTKLWSSPQSWLGKRGEYLVV